MQAIRAVLLLLILLFPSFIFAFQIDTKPFDWESISKKYQVINYTTEDGLPVNSVNYIVHHTDGFIYIATNDGLVRFDGDRFVVLNTSTHPEMVSNRILWISEGPSKELCFVDAIGNLYFLDGDKISRLQENPEFENVRVLKTNVTPKGLIILDTNEGLLEKRANDPVKRFTATETRIDPQNSFNLIGERTDFLLDDGWYSLEKKDVKKHLNSDDLLMPMDQVFNMIVTKDSTYWMLGYTNQLLSIDSQNNQSLYSISDSKEVTIWDAKELSTTELLLNTSIGYLIFNRVLGEFKNTPFMAESVGYFEDNTWTKLENTTTYQFQNRVYIDELEVLQTNREISFLTLDREGSVWVATNGDGIYQIIQKKMITLGNEFYPGLSNVYGMDEFNNEIWITSFEGNIFKITGNELTIWKSEQADFDYPFFRSIMVDNSDTIYAGNFNLWKFKDNQWYKDESFIKDNALIDVLFKDSKERFWLGTNENLFLYDGAEFKPFNDVDGQTLGGISSITGLGNGDLAISTLGQGVAILTETNQFKFINTDDGLSSNIIRDVYQTSKDTLWVVSEDKGLNRVVFAIDRSVEHIQTISIEDGLIDNSLHKIIEDDFGYFWINSNSGIMRVKESHLNKFLDNNSEELIIEDFTNKDGLLNIEGNGGTQGAGLLTDDGKLLFPNQAGIIYTQPEWHIKKSNSPSLSPIFETISFKDSVQSILNTDQISLRKDVRNIRVKFTLPTFSETHNLKLKYKLDGINETWEEVNSDRVAIFTNLPSGLNTLSVKGWKNGSEEYVASSILITVQPYFYETNWFIFISIFVLIGLFYSGYKVLLFQSRYREKKLEELVANRTKELVSEKEKTEEALQLIKKLDESKSQFFTNFTHELRTPLSLILSPLEEMLENDSVQVSKSRAPLSMMMRSANRLKDLVNQLLDVSKLNSGQLSLTFEEVDLPELTKHFTSQFDHSFHQKNISFTSNYSEGISKLYVDTSAWEHICTNILGNAIKFTPEGGHISIRMRQVESRVEIHISDTGNGIPTSDLPFIFDPYYQGDSSISKAGGTGIGLAIVKGMVDKMNGKISVESKVGSGTEFKISLRTGTDHISEQHTILSEPSGRTPLIHTDNTELLTNQELEKAPEVSVDAPKVLLVEDNPDFRAYLQSLIQRDYCVEVATNGREGLESLKEYKPDIIVSDVMMPEMNGYEMMREIRKIDAYKHIPFIFLSAKDSENDIQKGLNIGADIYLTKPVKNKLLLTQLKVLLRREQRIDTPSQKTVLNESPLIKNTIQIIKRHLGNPDLNVELIADALAMSSATLYRNWKKDSDETINQLINKLRLEEALKLIEDENLTISEAAYSVGYKHLSHFSRAFKKRYGISPKEYLSEKTV
tara:strand:+ start:26411 stop:30523 length:4113 start_codon:yes stop_codon:yes gene_type:complete